MPETPSSEDFDHCHREGAKNLEIERGRLAEARRMSDLGSLDAGLTSTLAGVVERIAQARREGPEAVFKTVLAASDDVDAKRHVIENLLESAKRGDNITEVLGRYQKLGLLPPPLPVQVQPTPEPVGTALSRRKSIWKRVGMAIAQIAVNAFKSVPKWIEVEPQLTLIGPVPVIGFSLKGKGMTVHDLFETLREGVSAAWSTQDG